jgi:hypothetical protein
MSLKGYPMNLTPQNQVRNQDRDNGYDQNYLGSDPNHQRYVSMVILEGYQGDATHREHSVDIAPDGEAYGLQDLQRSSSRSPLHPPTGSDEGK